MSSPAMDLYIAYSIVNLLTKPWEKWDAFKLGLIDDKGNKLKKAKTKEEKEAMTKKLIIVRNIKRLLGKLPGGNSKFATAAAALFLLHEAKEHVESLVESIINEAGLISESTNNLIIIGAQYSFNKHLFEDLLDVSGVVKVLKESFDIGNTKMYTVKDLVTREVFNLPSDLMEKFN